MKLLKGVPYDQSTQKVIIVDTSKSTATREPHLMFLLLGIPMNRMSPKAVYKPYGVNSWNDGLISEAVVAERLRVESSVHTAKAGTTKLEGFANKTWNRKTPKPETLKLSA